MHKNVEKIFLISILFAVFFFTLAFTTSSFESSEKFIQIFSVVSFLFGIFLSFSISDSQSRLSKINQLLKIDEANFLLVYKQAGHFGSKIQKKCRELIDIHLMDQLDYFLQDYSYSANSFYSIYDYFMNLEPKNKKEEAALENIIAILNNTSTNRKQVETFVLQKMSGYEWFSILTLLAMIFYFLILINPGGFLSTLLITLLATITTVLTLVLRELDTLKWKEDNWIWEPLHNLFLMLDLIPYYPEDVIKKGRFCPKAGSQIRLAHYANPYPDMSGKTIKIEEI